MILISRGRLGRAFRPHRSLSARETVSASSSANRNRAPRAGREPRVSTSLDFRTRVKRRFEILFPARGVREAGSIAWAVIMIPEYLHGSWRAVGAATRSEAQAPVPVRADGCSAAKRQPGRWQTRTDRRHVSDEPIAADQPVSSPVATLDSIFEHFQHNATGGFTAAGANAC
jgi:hypothetical protein